MPKVKPDSNKVDSKKADAKLSVKKGAAAAKPNKRGKPAKDPNKPKRPPSAFFVFMEEFRQEFKQQHPDNKSVGVVGKAAGAKWKSLSEAEKAPYVQKAAKRKADYEKNMKAYNKSTEEKKEEEEESDRSKSEVNDDEEGSDQDDDDDDDE